MTQDNAYNRKFLTGCGLVTLLAATILGSFVVYNLHQNRHTAHYPGATHITSRTHYQFPRYVRWQDSYRTNDNFAAVYHWYSTRFNLGAEARANGSCIELEGVKNNFRLERLTVVILCDTPKGQTINISRVTYWR